MDQRNGYHDGAGRLTDPVRNPQSAPSGTRTKRAFILLLLTLVLPGSAQVVAGNRRLGRRALQVTFTVWAFALAALVLALTNRVLLVTLVTNGWTSFILMLVLADMSVQPKTLMAGLVAATKSADTTGPTTTITTPAAAATLSNGSSVTTTGTASDTGGGRVAAVEVSTDGGSTWHPATGTTSWSYAFSVGGFAAGGQYSVRS